VEVDLVERRALPVRHQVGAVVEVDRILFAASLLHCLVQLKLLRLAVEVLVVLLLRLIVQTETLELLAAILRLERGYK
jgi:hypothetical protein